MATKNVFLTSDSTKTSLNDFTSDNNVNYKNLNLNQNHKFSNDHSIKSKSSYALTVISENNDNLPFQKTKSSLPWENKTPLHQSLDSLNLCDNNRRDYNEIDFRQRNSRSNSTLSLHIAAYEDSIEDTNLDDPTTDLKNVQLGKKDSSELFKRQKAYLQNSFEFPRQQNEEATNPELSRFRASQRLANPNQGTSKDSGPSMSMGEVESCSTLVASMRVPQLQAVLQSFNPQHSNGRKQELVQRIYNLLRDKKTSANTCQRIREITRTPSLNPSQPTMRTPFNQFQRLPQHPAYYQMRGNTQQQYANAFMPAQQQMGSNVPVVMPSRAGGRAERMQITRLPFYDVIDVVLKMSELQALSGRSGDVRSVFSFTLQPEHIPLISYRGDQPTPRYELQLRMFLFDTDIEQADDFPPNCAIKVDDNPVALPAIVPTNKPNAEQKRYSRPVDITQYIQSSRLNMNRTHKLEIDWFSDRRTWAVGIWLVYRQNANILLDRLLTTGIRRSADETKKKIAVMLDGDDDNIALDQLKISLLCPLMKTRMNIPARTKTCSHLQCFDLANYLNMCEKRPVWKCPQCNGNAHYDNLIIDQYFMDLLKAVEHNVEEVELERDGNWKILEVACDTLSDDDDDVSPAKAIKIEETSTSKSNKSAKKDDAEIITLDDSDDDNAPGSSEPPSRGFPFPSSVSTNLSSDAPTPPRTPLTTNGSNMSTSKSAAAAPTSSSSGPQAKQARMDDSRSAGGIRQSRSSSTSSSETESSHDSDHLRRRKIPASARTTSNGKNSTTPATSSSTASKSSTKNSNDAEVITLDSTDDEEEEAAARPARITESTSRSNSNDQTNSNGRNGSTDDSNNSPQINGTNGTAATKRQNGVHSDIAKRNQCSFNPITEAVEYEVADGLTQFINSVFLRDTRPSTFTAS